MRFCSRWVEGRNGTVGHQVEEGVKESAVVMVGVMESVVAMVVCT